MIDSLLGHCADARFVWNLGLEQRNLWRHGRTQHVAYTSQAAEQTEARKEFDWLGRGSVTVQQQALRDLDQAFRNWWGNPGHFGRPTWRSVSNNESFRNAAEWRITSEIQSIEAWVDE